MTVRDLLKAVCGVVVIATLAACIACGRATPRSTSERNIDPELVREQHRRIATYDSVVRSISTDSAYRIWHTMLTAENIRAAQLDMMCEYVRLDRRYGMSAANDAIKRMRDTLWKHDDPAAVSRMDRRLVGESPGIRRNTCGEAAVPAAPHWLSQWFVPPLPKLPPSPDSSGTR